MTGEDEGGHAHVAPLLAFFCSCAANRQGMATRVHTCHNRGMDATVVLGQQGRFVIPAAVRAALGLAAGDELQLHVQGDQLLLQRPRDVVSQLRRLAAAVPGRRSLVDELLEERRAAAARE